MKINAYFAMYFDILYMFCITGIFRNISLQQLFVYVFHVLLQVIIQYKIILNCRNLILSQSFNS